MTLIAAFLSEGSPTLVGDLLITSGQSSSARKKVHIFSRGFAVAWSGDQAAASSVLRTLSSIESENVSLNFVSSKLREPTTVDFGTLKVTLIGWIIEGDERHCFKWTSTQPANMLLGSPQFDGTGQATIERLMRVGPDGIRRPGRDEFPDADIRSTLFYVSGLMRSEMIGPTTRPYGFGVGYEVAMYRNGRFSYVDNIVYVPIHYKFDGEGKFHSGGIEGNIIKIESTGNESILYVVAENITNVQAIKCAIVGDASKLISEVESRVAVKDVRKLFSASYFSMFITLSSPGFTSRPIVVTFSGSSEQRNPPLEVSPDGYLRHNLQISTIEEWYELIHKSEQSEEAANWAAIDACEISSVQETGSIRLNSENQTEIDFPLYYNIRGEDGTVRAILLPNQEYMRYALFVAGSPSHLPKREGISRVGRINNEGVFLRVISMLSPTVDDVVLVTCEGTEIVFESEAISQVLQSIASQKMIT